MIAAIIDQSSYPKPPHSLRDLPQELVSSPAQLHDALKRLLARSPESIIVAGDDRFTGRLLTSHWRHLRSLPLTLSPIGAPSSRSRCLVASLNLPDDPERAAEVTLRAHRRGQLKRRSIPTLRLTYGSSPASELGFQLGARAVLRLWELLLRSNLPAPARPAAALAQLLSERTPQDAPSPILVDDSPLEDVALLATSLSSSWFGLKLPSSPSPQLYTAHSTQYLATHLAASRTPFLSSFNIRQMPIRSFERLVADRLDALLFDGELITPDAPCSLELRSGPLAPFLSP